ncbi:MAG: acetate--CoA ligase family protein [Candidatus Zixiibacteriota bacterium]
MKGSLDFIFRPKSIAVIGATNRKGSIGRELLHNIIDYEFEGKVFPVNPTKSVIHSIKCYSTILDVPDSVDLAVIVVPKELVLATVEQCGEKGVKGLVMITAGFKEQGKAGADLELKVAALVKHYNMRMIGPNCFGIINADPKVHLDATFSKIRPSFGKIGLISQSGALGEAILAQAQEINLGLSMFASIGNKADIDGNHIIEYWRDDPTVEIILLYLENFGDPRTFSKVAREVSRYKPIIVVKSGKTTQGAAAASSHTGALAGLDVSVDALFEQTGVIRANTIEEMFDVANALAKMPVPKGNRVAIVTNAGGPGILATDALIASGMSLPQFDVRTVKAIQPILPKGTPVHNPLDLVAGATGVEFRKSLGHVVNDPNIDSVIAICVPPVTIDLNLVADAIIDTANESKLPMFACFMGVTYGSNAFDRLRQANIPAMIFPESIATTLAHIDKYRRWLSRPEGKIARIKGDRDKVAEIIARARKARNPAVIGDDALQVLDAYKIAVAAYQYAHSKEEAARIAQKIGFPIVMKVNTPHILHKTEYKAVAVDLRTSQEVMEQYTEMQKRIKKAMPNSKEKFSVVIQEMITGGVETVIGMTTDPSFGPLIMFGLGGIYVEIMKDVSFRIAPLTDRDAKQMIESLKGYRLLTGFRGSKPVDIASIEDAISKLSQLVLDFPEFAEIDINPFIVTADKNNTRAVDARFVLTNS